MSGLWALLAFLNALFAAFAVRTALGEKAKVQACPLFVTPCLQRKWQATNAIRSSELAVQGDKAHIGGSNEYLSAVFAFQVAQKLRQGRPLLDAGVPSADMQQAALSHFTGYLGDAYEGEIRDRLEAAVASCQASEMPVPECARRILREFMAPLASNFTRVEVMEPQIALDRELQVLYSADLAASYVILFCPLKVRQELYRHLWGHGAFLDGSIDWLCCPWVLNQGKHDEGYHKLALDLTQLEDREVIDIIRLHKNYLSTDYVKQRSRSALRQLDRRSLLSVFQSVMLRVLWGNEAVTEAPKPRPSDDFINSPEDLARIERELTEGARKEEIRMNTLSGWLEEFRSKRCHKADKRPRQPERLQLRETEYIRRMKRSIEILTKHLDKFNETFKGVPGSTPFTEAARRRASEPLPGPGDVGEDVTIDRVRYAFTVLLDFYRGNLASSSELYGSLPDLRCLRLLKFLMSYEKHDLITLLSAVLLALPEFKQIETEQDFAQYAMLPFNTLAKLCFIAVMRINPDIANADVGITLEDAEIRANTHLVARAAMTRCQQTTGVGVVHDERTRRLEVDDGSDEEGDGSDGEDRINEVGKCGGNVAGVASMVFTAEELASVSKYIYTKRCNFMEATVGEERKQCLVLDSMRTRPVTEAILMHMSNYDAVYEVLKDRDVEVPAENVDQTLEAIRKYKLAAVVKTMTDAELDELYSKVIKSSQMHEELSIPEDIYKLTFHCLLDELEGGVEEDQLYTKLTQLLTRIDNDEENGYMVNGGMRRVGVSMGSDEALTDYETDEASDSYASGSDWDEPGETVTERGHCLNLLEGEDLTPFLDDSFSSRNPEDMTDAELRRLSEKVLHRIESSGNCRVIHYNPVTGGNKSFNLYALPMSREVGDHLRGNATAEGQPRREFHLCAIPRDTSVDSMVSTHVDVADDELQGNEPVYGPGIFPSRTPDEKGYSWQFPDTMPNFDLLRNRVTQDGVEEYLRPWQDLGLSPQVARAAVGWVRKCLLDGVNKVEQAGLEIEPTHVQSMAIKRALKSTDDVLIASNAASGKTLAYLLPIIQKLKEHEKNFLRHPNAPRALILVPSRELADQTLDVLKGLGHIVKLSSEGVAGGSYKGRQRDEMKRLVDIVVATPDRLLKMIKHVRLHKLQFLVLDEADTLLNEGFWPEVARVLDYIRQPYRLLQVSASAKYLLHFEKVQRALAKVPDTKHVRNKTPEVNAKYLERLTQCRQLVDTAWVDRPNRGVSHEFRYLKGRDKALELVNLLRYEGARRCKKVLVFCNSIQSCRAVEYILRDAGLPATSLHGKIPIMQRRRYYESFLRSSTGILVCSDLASRGLDFNADAVIMFDFPKNSMDYLKRCGRVGRMINNDAIAPRGCAISLVKKRDRNLATAIERSIRMPFFPISSLSRQKADYNQRSGRLRYLTQAGGYFKLAQLLRQEEVKGTYDYSKMDEYLEKFKARAREMYENSLKKIVLRRKRICKRRRILTRRLRLMKRYNRAIRLKQRIISEADRNRRLRRFGVHSPMKGDDRRCPRMKDLRPIRAKILALKLMEDKMTRRLLERNDRRLRKFINKTQAVARSLVKRAEAVDETLDRQLPFSILQRAKEKIGHKVKRICSLL
ncbi:RNA helicase family protein [Babesia caballi]|uniref:RNA helicase family protein n=1 Tax=Babesia caballi TaxID=5871 RepID=A0AAV4LQK1_BABCB|nr:RNA helicase family protein [Babesia caballi]